MDGVIYFESCRAADENSPLNHANKGSLVPAICRIDSMRHWDPGTGEIERVQAQIMENVNFEEPIEKVDERIHRGVEERK